MPTKRRRQGLGLALLGALSSISEFLALLMLARLLNSLSKAEADFGLPFSSSAGTAGNLGESSEALVFVLIVLVAGCLRAAASYVSSRWALNVGADFSILVQERVLKQDYLFYVSLQSSDLIAALEKVHVATYTVFLQAVQTVAGVLIALGIVGSMIIVAPLTTSVCLMFLIAAYLAVSVLAKGRLEASSRILATLYGRRVENLQNGIGGIRDIILDRSHRVFLGIASKIERAFATARAEVTFVGQLPRVIIETVLLLSIGAVAIYLLSSPATLAGSLPILGFLAVGAVRLVPIVHQIYSSWVVLASNRTAVGDVLALLDLPMHEEDDASFKLITDVKFDDICFDHVSYAYPTRSDLALQDISFRIKAGWRVGIIGASGSGKSTLLDLLMGLLEPSSGQIVLNGKILDGSTKSFWQKSLSHVPQSVFLMPGSIEENIAFGAHSQDLDVDRIVEAARLAHLTEFVEKLPNKYDTYVGERGALLSGGQRQRVGIARAIYKKNAILVLDEATNSLDPHLERLVIEGLGRLTEAGVTIIMVTHEASLLRGFDLVLRLDSGRLSEASSKKGGFQGSP